MLCNNKTEDYQMVRNRWLLSFGLLSMLIGSVTIGAGFVGLLGHIGTANIPEFCVLMTIAGLISLAGAVLFAISFTSKDKEHF